MTANDGASSRSGAERLQPQAGLPIVIATTHREEGTTGVQTHVRQLRQYLQRRGMSATLLTPFSWGGVLRIIVFGPRLILSRFSGPAGLVWHRHWHEVFLRYALRRHLAGIRDCVIYAQGPLAARAALQARQGPHQRVIMAIHFRVSQADEWADSKTIKRNGRVFRGIRQVEREVIPKLDGLLSVSDWARDALVSWLPEAEAVPYAVIGNFVSQVQRGANIEPVGDLVTIGRLEPVKNHQFLLDVLAEAKRAGQSYTLDVFGDGPLKKELLQQARNLALEEQIRLRGFRPDVRGLLPRYRAYVHASYSESSSLAIMEAMAAGLPIVAANIGAIAELCDDGVEARFWPLDDPAHSAAILADLLEREPARAKASRAASERFQRDFDAEVMAPRLLSFLQATKSAASADPG